MFKKVIAGSLVLLLVAGLSVFFWARTVLETDAVRNALASQLSKALGQPVTVQSVAVTIYPRVTITLRDVSIGETGQITLKSIDVGTALGALLSRRIEHASLHVADARVELPLPDLRLGSSGTPASTESTASSPVTLVSIDEVILTGIQVVSRGRTLSGDIELVPHGTTSLTIRKVALTADGAHIDATGEISNLAGPVGTLDVKAGALDLDQLVAFASDFAEGSARPAQTDGAPGSGTTAGTQTSPSPGSTTDLTISIAADRATMSGVALERVSGKARLQGTRLTLDPMQFGLFGGTYEGALGATLTQPPSFSWKAALKNVDVAAVTAFAGNPSVVTGRLSATIDLVGTGIDAATALKSVRGQALVSITNGVVQNLALVKSAVAATSLNPQAVIASSQGNRDEPFSEMGATLAIAGGTASTQDLHFVSKDIRLDAGGGLRLDGTAVTPAGCAADVRSTLEASQRSDRARHTAGWAHHASGDGSRRRRQVLDRNRHSQHGQASTDQRSQDAVAKGRHTGNRQAVGQVGTTLRRRSIARRLRVEDLGRKDRKGLSYDDVACTSPFCRSITGFDGSPFSCASGPSSMPRANPRLVAPNCRARPGTPISCWRSICRC